MWASNAVSQDNLCLFRHLHQVNGGGGVCRTHADSALRLCHFLWMRVNHTTQYTTARPDHARRTDQLAGSANACSAAPRGRQAARDICWATASACWITDPDGIVLQVRRKPYFRRRRGTSRRIAARTLSRRHQSTDDLSRIVFCRAPPLPTASRNRSCHHSSGELTGATCRSLTTGGIVHFHGVS